MTPAAVLPRVFAYLALLTTHSFVTFGLPLHHPMRAWQAFQLLLFATGCALDSKRAQEAIAASTAAQWTITLGFILAGNRFEIALE